MSNFTVEIGGVRQKYLIVDPIGTPYTLEIKKILSVYDVDMYVAPVAPPSIKKFDICFFINVSDKTIDFYSANNESKIAFIFTNNKRAESVASVLKNKNIINCRVISAGRGLPEGIDIEKIIWFVSTPSNEWLLNIYKYHDPVDLQRNKKKIKKKPVSKLLLGICFILLILIVHAAFIIPLLRSSYYEYQSFKALQSGDSILAMQYVPKIESSLSAGTNLYSIARPSLLFFGLAELPDNIFQLNESGLRTIKIAAPLIDESKSFTSLLLKESADELDLEIVKRQQTSITSKVEHLYNELLLLNEKLPEWNSDLKKVKSEINDLAGTLDIAHKLLPHIDELLAADGSKKYLLLFANNMELRPGGGFIGSFGILNVERFKIKSVTIYDVYDADGQLDAHIPPPNAIRDYLHQPHWFLRDSAFSPDFRENYFAAVKFLDREMGFTNFDGGILVTTTAIQSILEGAGPIYVAEYRETINKDNFYLKAQLFAEKDFFPGSIQKKSFLSAVADSLMIHLEDYPSIGALRGIVNALNEKQIVLNFEDESVQSTVDSLYWTGRVIMPVCTVSDVPCAVDYLFPYDANLGVNKANFFVTQSTSFHVVFDKNGDINNRLKIIIKNNSPNDVFPGGIYKNYFQVMLPSAAEIKEITNNTIKVASYDETLEQYKKIGFYIEIPHSSVAEVVVNYTLRNTLHEGKSVYQLVLQKQIGSPDYDFELSVKLPNSIYLLNKNFSALVKDNAILYNTSIKADKIFLIEIMRNTQ